jgi:nucleoside-diphosphate-sugar epimerase
MVQHARDTKDQLMKILITGHRGFVGKYFMQKYQDHDITGIDLKDGNDCRDFFRSSDQNFDMIIHLAAIVGGRATIEGAPLSVAADLSIDAEMCQWALKTKPGRVIYFSSSAAYPTQLQTQPYRLKEDDIDLNDTRNPDMTYGWAKLTGEYCLQFLAAEGIRTHVFRPFSGYGTDQDLDYPFPSYIARGRDRLDPFEIWGDGTQVRDFIHISDVIEAVDAAIREDITGPCNLGSGVPTSFNELAKMVSDQMGYQPQFKHIINAPKGVDYRCSDNTKMLSFYKPRITLQEGIDRALRGQK